MAVIMYLFMFRNPSLEREIEYKSLKSGVVVKMVNRLIKFVVNRSGVLNLLTIDCFNCKMNATELVPRNSKYDWNITQLYITQLCKY